MEKYKWGELGLKVLYAVSVGIMIPAALAAPNVPQSITPLLRRLAKKIDTQPQATARALAALKRKRLISFEERGEKMVIVISADGKKRLAQGELGKMTIKRPQKWDGKWHIVIFDIPEKQKAAREAFRKKLRELGFQQLQKSCFVHPFECRKEIDMVSAFFDIVPHITYIVADSFEGERAMRTSLKI